MFVVAAQFFGAMHYVTEEKFIGQYDVKRINFSSKLICRLHLYNVLDGKVFGDSILQSYFYLLHTGFQAMIIIHLKIHLMQ